MDANKHKEKAHLSDQTPDIDGKEVLSSVPEQSLRLLNNPSLTHIPLKESEPSSGGSEGELQSTSEASYSYHDAEQYLEASEPRVNVQHLEGVRLRDYVQKQRELYR